MIKDREQQEIWRVPLEPPGRLTAALDYYRANFKTTAPRRWQPVGIPVMAYGATATRHSAKSRWPTRPSTAARAFVSSS